MEGLGTINPTNDYAYNSKELNEDFGLNLTDYGARWYDAALGRWWGVDPLAEVTPGWSSYNYVANNPNLFIDPNGMRAAHSSVQTGSLGGGIPSEGRDPTLKTDVISGRDAANAIRGSQGGIWPPPYGVPGQIHSDGDGDFISNGENWQDFETGNTVLSEVEITASKYTLNKTIGAADNIGDHIDPFVGASLYNISKHLERSLKYHSFTTGEGFKNSLNRAANVNTWFGRMSARSALNAAGVLGKVGVGLTFLSVGNYGVDIYNGETAKGLTGLAVIGATIAASTLCPPCALIAIGASAAYSLYLEDKIFQEPK